MTKIEPIIYDSYIAVIKNSVGANTWRNFYAKVDDKKVDIMQDGDLSCAFFVSSILSLFGLIKHPHTTVESTIKDMEESGWQEIKKPKIGSVLIWEAITDSKEEVHRHIGFYIGNKTAISNSSKKRVPVKHHWTFGEKNGKPIRKIEKIFWHKKLD
jgi:hypothetical protein